jgi:hypothetical protein
MVFNAEFTLEQQTIDNYRSLGETAPRTLQAFLGGTMTQHLDDEVNRRLAVTPGAVATPIDWQTPKQKAYYFGFVAERDGEGNILPYVRTGGFNQNWFARFNLNNFSIGVGNSTMTKGSPNWPSQPLYDFLVGGQQQRFHKNTGWIQADDPLLEIIIASMDILADAWQDIIGFEGALL